MTQHKPRHSTNEAGGALRLQSLIRSSSLDNLGYVADDGASNGQGNQSRSSEEPTKSPNAPNTTSPKLFQEGTVWVKERLNSRCIGDCFWVIRIYRQGRKRAEKLVHTVDQAAGNLNVVSVNLSIFFAVSMVSIRSLALNSRVRRVQNCQNAVSSVIVYREHFHLFLYRPCAISNVVWRQQHLWRGLQKSVSERGGPSLRSSVANDD